MSNLDVYSRPYSGEKLAMVARVCVPLIMDTRSNHVVSATETMAVELFSL
jgi:hypothetical protein